jgi:hypothetical protein
VIAGENANGSKAGEPGFGAGAFVVGGESVVEDADAAGSGVLVGRLASFWARLADVHANMRANPSPRIQFGDRFVFMATPLPFQFAAVNRTDSGRPDNIHSKQRKIQAFES